MLSPTEILSENGPLADLITGFTARSQQQELAETIISAIHDGESLICEAGTGTGKTFAYLVPAILSGRKVLISTGTKHLQDQLFKRDLPLVRKALNIPINIALLKGRSNYLCLHRLTSAEIDGTHLPKASRALLVDIRRWSQQSSSGDLAELTDIPEDAGVRSVVTSTAENCLGQECDAYDKCFVFKARRHANEADLTVVNHHLYLADMNLRQQGYGELLPAADIVIFDEAHQLPALASKFFSQTLSARQIQELLRDSKSAYFAEAADLPEFLQMLDKVEKAVRDLRLSFGRDDLRIAWQDIKSQQQVSESLNGLLTTSDTLQQLLKNFADRGKQLDSCYKRLTTILDMLACFVEPETGEFIQWLETRGKGFFFHQTPLDVAEIFQARLSEYECRHIYTSATLTVNNHFKHFTGQLGLDDIKAESWQSPFDFKKQALLYLPEGLPEPRDINYTERVVETAIPVLKTTQGRAFFLFTSHRALRIAAETITDQIDYPVLVQGDAPRTELLETFRTTRHAVLLGTSSFWEGVDVKGQALSCVIIDKLPFASPDDPVLKARMKKLQEQGRNPFMEYQLPEAVLTLKQGIGRLIRDRQDYGVLMICDPRLKTKAYGKVFLRSLPKMQLTHSLSDVETFFHAHEKA